MMCKFVTQYEQKSTTNEKSLTKGRMGGRLVRLGMTALLMALPATAFPVPSKGGVDAPEQVIQKDEPQKPKRKITGQLLDEQGEPLIGASVAVKGTSETALP